jgi:PAS domain S-box-containing protein
MSKSGASEMFENRIERVSIWLLRIVLCLLLVTTLFQGEIARALALALVLAVHGVVHWAAPRIPPSTWKRWAITLVDVALSGFAFYTIGDAIGLAMLLGVSVMATVAARLGLWKAFAVNVALWLLFSGWEIYSWLWQGEPFSGGILTSLIIALALTWGVNYLAVMEARQTRAVRDVSLRLRQLSIVNEVGRTVTSTLDVEAVLDLIVHKSIDILNAQAGSLLLLDKGTGDLMFSVALGPVSGSLLGQRIPSGAGIAGAALQSGEGQIVNDVQADSRWYSAPDLATGFETRSVLCVPLTSRGRPIGALEAINKLDGSLFDNEDLELLSNFAVHAAVALENAQLHESTDEALKKSVQELATLHELDREFGSTLDFDRIISLVLERAMGACSANFGLIAILSPDGERMEALTWKGMEPDLAPKLSARDWPVESGAIGRVLRTGETAILLDVSSQTDHSAALESTRSMLAVPIKSEERLLGVLSLESEQTAAFTDNDLRFLVQLADRAGTAIENARMYQQAHHQVQAFVAVGEITREILLGLDLDQTLNRILVRARELVHYDSAEICLWDKARAVMVTACAAGDSRQEARAGTVYRLDDGYAGWIARHRQPLLITDTSTQADIRPRTYPRDLPIRSYVGLPLVTGDAFVGSLGLASNQPRAFAGNELEILKTLADQAAIAIETVRRSQEREQRVQELSGLNQIAQAMGSTTDIHQVCAQINERIASLSDVEMCGILLYDETQQALVSQPPFFGIPEDVVGEYRLATIDDSTAWRFWREQEALILNGVEDEPLVDDLGFRSLAQRAGMRDTLLAPMFVGQRSIGVIQVINKADKTPFTADDARRLGISANQAAAVVENARLLATQQQQIREMGILFETSSAFSSSLELPEVLSTVARHMAYALEVSSCTISNWDPAEATLATLVAESTVAGLVATPDTRPVGTSLSLTDHPVAARVLHERRPLVIQTSDPDADPALRALLEEAGQKSLLMMPLETSERVVGLLELHESRHERGFSVDDIRFCRALANQAALAIENARLYQQTAERLRDRIDELTALQRTMQELNATLELDRILHKVLSSAVQTTRATHGNVMLIEIDSGHLVLRAAYGYSAQQEAAISELLLHPDADTITLEVVQSGESQIVADVSRDSCLTRVRSDTRSALLVPIFYQDAVVGLINLRNTQAGAFSQEDQKFVQALAEQAAIAIGNAMRYEEQVRVNNILRQRTEQMDGLLAVSQKLRTDTALKDILEEVAYAIQETVGFNIVLISVVEDMHTATPMLQRVAAAGLPLDAFEEARGIRQPLDRYERILREEYHQGPCYFFPFQREDDWAPGLHTMVPMSETEEWREGRWHSHDMLLAPMRGAGGRLLGHVSVDEPRDGLRPSMRTLETLAIFANQAAIAVENANLYADVRRRAENLALINEVGQTLTHLVEPDQVLDTVVKAVSLLLQCEVGAVFQPDPVDGKFSVVASYGVEQDALIGLRFAPGEGLVGHVAVTCEPLVVPDVQQDPRFVEGPVPVSSMMLAPIVVGRHVIGVLTASSPRPQSLSQADSVLLTTLADQAAVALESTRLLSSAQLAAVRLASLNEIGRRVAAQLRLEDMLETMVDSLHEFLGYSRVGIFLIEHERSELYPAVANDALWRIIPPDYCQKMGAGLIGAAAATGRTILANDPCSDERYLEVGGWHVPASVSVPIQIADRVIGVLEVEAEQPGAFTEEDAAALEIAADQLAVAVENANLLQQTQRRVAELATVNEIGRAISSALHTDQLAELIYGQVSNLLNTRNFHIAHYQPESGLIDVEFLVERGQRQPPVLLTLGQGLTSHVLRTGEPTLLTNGVEEFMRERDLVETRQVAKSWLGVPMIAEDRVIGAIAVQSFDREGAFDAGHLELLTTIAGQAATAYHNASLFQERQQRIEQLNVLSETAQAISATLDLEALLEVIYQQASRIVDTTNFFIALWEEDEAEISFPFVVDPEQRDDWQPQAKEVGLTGIVVDTGRPLLLPTVEAELDRNSGLEVDLGLCRSWLGVPMIAEDKVLGVIAVQDYEQECAYNPEHVRLLSTLAAQAAVALRNAQLYRQIVGFSGELEAMVEARTREVESALDELTIERDRVGALYRITSELGATLELERVLQRALQLFADALGVGHGTILLVDQETGLLTLRATLEPDRQLPREGLPTRWRLGTGLAGWILEHREPVLIADISQDTRWVHHPDRPLRIRSVVSAPLSLAGGDILGVLTLGHPDVDYFTREHLQLVTAATSQIAMAVNNSDLYAFITDQADQLGAALQSQREEAAKSQSVLESIADGVLVLDHNGRVLLVNPAAEELLGFSGIALEGQHFRHMLGLGETPVHRELARSLYSELRKKMEADADAALVPEGSVRLEAETRVLAVNIAPLIVTLGSTPGLVAALRDITREAEVERLKNEFISTVSHELRTPMTSIKGYTDLLFLGMAGGLTDTQRNFLKIIKSNADRLTALVNDILDISRIETGRMRLNIESLDLAETIGQVVVSFEEQYRDKDLTLRWEEPRELPQIRGDAARVTQVLSNLLANAWQYTPDGGAVTLSVVPRDAFMQVDVVDSGIGISSDDADRIFDRFYRADHPVVQEAEGSGLGLSIVKMFVEMLGGEIWVESQLGVGSKFSFTIPLASAEMPVPPPDLLGSELAPGMGHRPKILVVEDDRDLALLLRRQLESEGYRVLLATKGEDALWLAREAQPQLITLDIMLPDVDGFTVLEQLKENPLTSGIPVVIVSVLTDAEKGYALGAVDYVVKPFEEPELLEVVQNALLSLGESAPHRIVVADDDPEVLALLDEALTLHGYQVWTASDGQEALERVRECEPDLILLDTQMPVVDGYDVIRELKGDESTRPIPVIAITASPVDKERDRVRVLGMEVDQYVTKPLSIEMLIQEIKKATVEGSSA